MQITKSEQATILCVYLHGFRSSSLSTKANQAKQYFHKHHIKCYTPDLPPSPNQSIEHILDYINDFKQANPKAKIGLVGSSLGGFYASYIANECQIKAVLVNPAVNPVSLLKQYSGKIITNFVTGAPFCWKEEYAQQLKSIEIVTLNTPENYLLLTQTGDETLDYREGVEYFSKSLQEIIEGGNHSFENFEQYLPKIHQFLFD